jgi:D-proline reductase (dithiol) PrdB
LAKPSLPISYIQRTTDYYAALGYTTPYQWASYSETPISPLSKTLENSRLTIVTTAAPYNSNLGDQDPGASYNSAAKFYRVYEQPTAKIPDLRISHIAIDRDHTSAEDLGSYFPLEALTNAVRNNRIGEIADNFYGLPTNRSIRTTVEVDCPELVSKCQQAAVDAVILVPNCPVCHQSVSLAARSLEAAGIATVIMGCALDIVKHVGAPRLLFNDFPLGNSAGRPNDKPSQNKILSMALDLLEQAKSSRSVRHSNIKWSDNNLWKGDYYNVEKLSESELSARKLEFDKGKQLAKTLRT